MWFSGWGSWVFPEGGGLAAFMYLRLIGRIGSEVGAKESRLFSKIRIT